MIIHVWILELGEMVEEEREKERERGDAVDYVRKIRIKW